MRMGRPVGAGPLLVDKEAGNMASLPGNAGSIAGEIPFLANAIEYAERGWSIIPVVGKEPPRGFRWKEYQSRRADPEQLRGMFDRPDVTGLAVVLGSASGGLVVRDFDTLASYDDWARANPRHATILPTVKTARGRHVYFRGPEYYFDFGDGEYRGDSKHYVLLPPSIHPSGKEYEWVIALPTDDPPLVEPISAGLLRGETEKTERTQSNGESGGKQRKTEAMGVTWWETDPGVQDAIARTLPTRGGQRNRCLFALARHLKAIPALASAQLRIIRPIVKEWHRRALSVIQTKDFLETWTDFSLDWKKVKFPIGQGAIDLAFQEAKKSKPTGVLVEFYEEEPRLRLLANLCKALQILAGDNEFFLDCRTAGRLIGIPHTTAWRWLVVLCADGILDQGQKGNLATHKASRFRYVAD